MTNPQERALGVYAELEKVIDLLEDAVGHVALLAHRDLENVVAADEEDNDAVKALVDPETYRAVYQSNEVHPCEVPGCRLSQEEHHRLAYGIMNENRELKRKLRNG